MINLAYVSIKPNNYQSLCTFFSEWINIIILLFKIVDFDLTCCDYRALVKLNLSYNQIHNLSGLLAMQGSEFKLSQLDLQGNRIQSLQHVVQCLSDCPNMRHLTVTHNPLCQNPGKLSVSGQVPCNLLHQS